MKRSIKKRIGCAALCMTTALTLVTTTGCNKKESSTSDEVTRDVIDNIDKDYENSTGKTESTGSIQLLSNINSFNAASANMNFEYTDSQYNVEEDHIFEFDASEEAGNVAYDAFKVYVSEDTMNEDIQSMKENGYHTEGYFCESHYENGKIRVSPDGAPKLNETGSYNQDGDVPTWGAYNRLFLAQWIDLETGKELDKPIVTIFSVNHKLDAPIVSQTLDENNNYMLTWNAVPGATKYSVFVMLDDVSFAYEGTTTDTNMICKDFETEKTTLTMLDTFYMEDTGCRFGMNYSIPRYAEEGYKFVVIAENDSTKSGISNFINIKDIAGAVPTETLSDSPTFNITKALDAPMYMDIVMADGSTKQMMVDYHGAHIYQEEDESIYVSARYLNTNMACTFKLTGIPYEEFRDGGNDLKTRQDEATQTNTTVEVDNRVSQVPNSEEEENAEEAKRKLAELELEEVPEVPVEIETPEVEPTDVVDPIEEVESTTEKVVENPTEEIVETIAKPTEEITTEKQTESVIEEEIVTSEAVEPIITEEPTEVITTEEITQPTTEPSSGNSGITVGTSNNAIYNSIISKIESIYSEYSINVDDLSKVIYADSQLEAYLAYALTARLDVIPVPTDVFPEATNVEYLATIFMETYRQNPTSGVMCDLRYSYDDEALLVTYSDDTSDRLSKTKEELSKAKELANSTVNDSMSDIEKIYTMNQYFCDNASYDFNSMSTDVDMSNLSQPFIDAHTPYGILCNNYGVCESYSEAFALTGRFAGFNVIMETGYLNGGGHEWNKIQLGNDWYIIDITNNDLDLAKNSLLLVSEDQAKVLSADHTAYTFDAIASDTSKEYYTNKYGLIDNPEKAVSSISEQLDNNDSANVRFNYDISEDEAIAILQNVYNNGYSIDKYAIFNNVVGVSK